MDKLNVQVEGNPSDEYLKTPAELSLLTPDGAHWLGYAKRTGITPPGYPDRAVYSWGNDYYVYEGGALFLSKDWRESKRVPGLGAFQDPDVLDGTVIRPKGKR